MNIQELEDKHYRIDEGEVPIPISFVDSHTKLSVEFAINKLENILNVRSALEILPTLRKEIQELKQYLDENKI